MVLAVALCSVAAECGGTFVVDCVDMWSRNEMVRGVHVTATGAVAFLFGGYTLGAEDAAADQSGGGDHIFDDVHWLP